MTRSGLTNGLAATACVALACAAALLAGNRASPDAVRARPAAAEPLVRVELADGRPAIVDDAGTPVPIAEYRRIISSSSLTDWLLTELCERDRIAAITRQSAEGAPWRHRFSGLPVITAISQLEDLIRRKPDLILAASFGDPRRLARLSDAGLVVFDIGTMRGKSSLIATIRRLGALLGRSERAELLAGRIERSLEAIAADIPPSERRAAVYVSAYGGKLFGGTIGTGYHDILVYAGLIDRAKERFAEWPEYSPEDLLALDPELLVTRQDMAAQLCSFPGLERLRACQIAGSIIELENFALDDPGLGILESAESLHRAVYGKAR